MLFLAGQPREYSKADSLAVSKSSPLGIDMSLGAVVIGFRLMLRLPEHHVALPGDQAFQKPALDRISFGEKVLLFFGGCHWVLSLWYHATECQAGKYGLYCSLSDSPVLGLPP
jgi:hypothetical protein